MVLFWIFNFFIFLALRLPSLFEPYWYADEGIYLTLGNAIRHGVTLYSGIHDNKPPILYYLAALGHTVFGFRLILLLVMIPTIIYFYKLSKKIFNSKISAVLTLIFTVATSIPFFEGTIANAEIFMILPTIIGIYYLLENRFFLAGLGFGIAFAIKSPVFIEAFFGLLWLLFILQNQFKTKIKQAFFYLLGCGLPISLFGVYFILKGAFQKFLFSSILMNFGYLSSWQTGSMNKSPFSGGLTQRLIILFIFLIILYIINRKKIINSKTIFLLGWFATTIFACLLSGRPYPHYLIQTLPPLILLIGFFPYFIFAFIFLIFIIRQFHFYFYKTIPYYQNFYLQNNNLSYYGAYVANTYKISEYIKKNTIASDKIFIWGDEPYIYALSDRLPAGRYTVAYHISDFNGYAETITAIEKNKPKFIIYFSMENRPYLKLDELLIKSYVPVNQIGSALLFKLK